MNPNCVAASRPLECANPPVRSKGSSSYHAVQKSLLLLLLSLMIVVFFLSLSVLNNVFSFRNLISGSVVFNNITVFRCKISRYLSVLNNNFVILVMIKNNKCVQRFKSSLLFRTKSIFAPTANLEPVRTLIQRHLRSLCTFPDRLQSLA